MHFCLFACRIGDATLVFREPEFSKIPVMTKTPVRILRTITNDTALSIHAKIIPQRRGDAEDYTAGCGFNLLINNDLDKASD